jgi:hypothetical protein
MTHAVKQLLRFEAWTVALIMLGSVLLTSCATSKPKEYERAGIKGTVIPVDSDGEEIVMEDKENIVINCIPVKDGKQQPDRAIVAHAKSDGDFAVDLRGGEFVVEIFLEGFYVESIGVLLDRNRRKNLGKIKISRIETGRGVPAKDEIDEEIIINEGDVNIQPPVQ